MPISQHPESWRFEKLWPSTESAKPSNGSVLPRIHSIRSGQEYVIADTKEPMDSATKAAAVAISSRSVGAPCTDRAELIERIKRGESPKWIPSETLQREYMKENGAPISQTPPQAMKYKIAGHDHPSDIDSSALRRPSHEHLYQASEIERPPSALHAGDFNHDTSLTYSRASAQGTAPSLSQYYAVAPWRIDVQSMFPSLQNPVPVGSFYSSYVLKKPTTPLVQQSNNGELDSSERERSASPDKGYRRHTLPPQALREWRCASTNIVASSSPPHQPHWGGRQDFSGSPSHRPRRSLTSTWSLQQPSSPPIPAFLRSRRTSFSSEASPRQRASMVGSYEESILHGRMSTAPSKPFDFHAHIGALGRGKKPKMPPHIIVPFQAVFYDWSSNTRLTTVCDEPSPYVGNIELQQREKHPPSQTAPEATMQFHQNMSENHPGSMDLDSTSHFAATTKRRRKRFRKEPTDLPEGHYRIPEQGQIQVVVKNSYKTALKLFLVPYDLSRMEPGQKTFVRQRYYSAGPIIERPVVADGLSALPLSDRRKSTLRYLIHLKMCCPAKGFFCLYSNIRIVFANRVPDDKEYLSKDLQEPNPKYSAWKSSTEPRDTTPASTAMDGRISRRRSSGSYHSHTSIEMERFRSHTGAPFPYTNADAPPVPPIPFHLPPRAYPTAEALSPQGSEKVGAAKSKDISVVSSSPESGDSDNYRKFNKGEIGYGGSFESGTQKPVEGLLARRLRTLGNEKTICPYMPED